MSSSEQPLQPIKVHSHASGPNSWKTTIVLEELGLPYEIVLVDFAHIKQEPYISINPNGRVPAIEDPNTGITLWESGACNEYLIETYDKEGKISFAGFPEKFMTKQWLFYQVSGQGPYFGQAAWFMKFHHEQLPSAQDRYVKEMERVIGVLDVVLSDGREWLVISGEKRVKDGTKGVSKCTYADLSFITWAGNVDHICGEDRKIDIAGKYPHYAKWVARILEREAVKKVLAVQMKMMSG